jgi:hypothetical protein
MKYKQGVADMFISNEIGDLIPTTKLRAKDC